MSASAPHHQHHSTCQSGCSRWQHDIMNIRDPLLFLLVFLNMIDLTKGKCHDYFTSNKWKITNDTTFDMVTLAETKNSKDVVECTLHNYCENKKDIMCFLLEDCFEDKNQSEKCSPPLEISRKVTIHGYHFMCMLEKEVNYSTPREEPGFCQYETVCRFFAETNSDRTSPPPQPTTALLQTTTAFQPTTTLQPTTTTTTTTLRQPTIKTTTSPPPPTTTAATVPTQGPGSMEKRGQNCNDKAHPDILILRLCLSITSVLTVVLPLAVYFYMRKQEAARVFHGISPGAAESSKSNTSHANGQTTHFMQLGFYLVRQLVSQDHDRLCACVRTTGGSDQSASYEDFCVISRSQLPCKLMDYPFTTAPSSP